MEKTQNIWGNLATGYFFLAGTAAVIGLVVAVIDIAGGGELARAMAVMGGAGNDMFSTYLFNNFIALALAFALAGIGGVLLLAELTQKFRFPLVFTNPKSLMTIGAFALSGFMGLTFIYALFFLNIIPFDFTKLRFIVAVLLIISAVVLAAYPALEMAEARGRGFWRAGLVPLFFINALVCGSGLLMALGFRMAPFFFLAVLFNMLVLAGYLWSTELSGGSDSRRGVDLLLRGRLKTVFFGGAVLVGLILPAVIIWFSPVLAGVLAFVGGGCFRYAFMKAGVRLELPGERNVKYTDKEIESLAHSLEARWQEKAKTTGGN